MTRLHAAVAILVCLVIPAISRSGAGLFAWTMYSRSAGFRLSVRGRDASGAVRAISPTELSARGRGPAVTFLAGAERFRHHPGAAILRAHLADVAALACRVAGAGEVELILKTRANLDAPVETTTLRRDCGREPAH